MQSPFSANGNSAPPMGGRSTPTTIPASGGKPTAHSSAVRESPEEPHHINADLYRTFSPTDVAMWDWREIRGAGGAGGRSPSGSLWSKIFGPKS